MRRLAPTLALLLALGCAPAYADEPQAAAATATAQASDADIDRLLQAIDMKSMMDNMMRQMWDAQQATMLQTFGKDLSEKDRADATAFMQRTHDKLRARLAWENLEPLVRRVYAQVFTKAEVDAMVAFYTSPEGASILKKSPQAMALTMQEMQPMMRDIMQDMKADMDAELKARKD